MLHHFYDVPDYLVLLLSQSVRFIHEWNSMDSFTAFRSAIAGLWQQKNKRCGIFTGSIYSFDRCALFTVSFSGFSCISKKRINRAGPCRGSWCLHIYMRWGLVRQWNIFEWLFMTPRCPLSVCGRHEWRPYKIIARFCRGRIYCALCKVIACFL